LSNGEEEEETHMLKIEEETHMLKLEEETRMKT